MTIGLIIIETILVLSQLFFLTDESGGHPYISVDEEFRALQDLRALSGEINGSVTSKVTGRDSIHERDATMIILDIRRKWGQWSPEFRKIAQGYFLWKPLPISSPIPGTDRITPVDKGGENTTVSRGLDLTYKKALLGGTHLLPNWVETDNFSIEWGNNLGNIDNYRHSDKIRSCSKESCNWIPDLVDDWADYFEEVWEKEISTMGYQRPTGTDRYLYDVYIANTGDDRIGNDDDLTPKLGYNFLGMTTTYCDPDRLCVQGSGNEEYTYITVNKYFTNPGTMKITAAHEFFHAIQFGYPTFDRWYSLGHHWWIEATATWMEEAVYDDVNAYYSRVQRWLKEPWLSLKNSGDHEYGDVLFVIFMTDLYLKDRDFVKHVWEDGDTGIAAIDNVLASIYKKGDFESAFKEFVALNAVADIGPAKGGYEEGAWYGKAAPGQSHNQYPLSTILVNGESAPHELGANYILFLPPDNNDNLLTIEFDGEDSINFGAMIVKVRSDGTGFEREEISLDPLRRSGCLSIEGFGTTYSEIFLVPAVLIDPGLDGSASYAYRSDIGSVCGNTPDLHLTQSESRETASPINRGGSRCFIATAAFGSGESPYVKILREFRDRYLMPYSAGMRLVDLYYSISPTIADFIEDHPTAAFLTRAALLPVVGISFLLIRTTPAEKLIFVITIVVSTFIIRSFLSRKLTK